MKVDSVKRTSRLAVASAICIIATLSLAFVFCVSTYVGLHEVGGGLVIGMLLFSAAAFALGILALVLIAFRHKQLKGSAYAVLGTLLATPFILFMASGIYVAKGRAESLKANTAQYNLRLLGEALIRYAEDHNGYLPAADEWCDLLIEHNNQLTGDRFTHPNPDRLQLNGTCHFAFNRNLSGSRLADVPDDVVLLFEADGDWNLNGTSELLRTRYRGEHSSIAVLFAGQTVSRYWFNVNATRKFDSRGMHYERPRWKP